MKIRSLIGLGCICLAAVSVTACSSKTAEGGNSAELGSSKNAAEEKSEKLNGMEEKFQEADALEAAGKEEEACRAYESILEEDENNPAAYTGIAYLYGKLGNFEKAVEYIELARKYLPGQLEPDQIANAYYIMGDIYQGSSVYEGMKYEEDAIEAYKMAAEVEDISAKNRQYYTYKAYIHIVDILQNHSDKESLETCVAGTKKLLEADEANGAHYTYLLADFYGQLGEYEKARECLDSLQGADEAGKIDLIFANAKYCLYKGENDKALEYMNQLNEENCRDQMEKYLLLNAFYAEKTGNTAGVKEYIELLLDKSVTNLNLGIVQDILKESGTVIDVKYQQALEEEKEKAYGIVLGEK